MEPQTSHEQDSQANATIAPAGAVGTVERAKNIMLKPRQEWLVVEPEPTTAQQLYKSYIAPLAAIGPVCSFIGFSVIGMTIPFVGHYRTPIGAGIGQAILTFILALLGVFIVSLIINALAPSFDGQKDQRQALKVAAYSYTPSYLAGFLALIPALSVLGILLSLYGLYLLYHGLTTVMKSPPQKTLGYTVVVVICAIVLGMLLAFISAAVIGFGAYTAAPTAGNNAPLVSAPSTETTSPALAKLEAATKKMEAATAKMEKGGPESAQGLGDMLAALSQMAGGETNVEPIAAEQMRALLPAELPGMRRTSATAEKNENAGIAVSSAKANYQEGKDKRITLKIDDFGTMSGLAAFANRFAGPAEKITDTGYEKTRTIAGRKVQEKFDKKSKGWGKLEMMVADRFMVEAEGYGIDIDTLKTALGKVDLAKLESLKTQTVKSER